MSVDTTPPSGTDDRARPVPPEAAETSRAFSRRTMAIWLITTGLVGAAASFLLLHERILLWQDPEHSTACDINPWVSCGEVMDSWQAATFGFPNIFLGVVGFPVVIAVGITLLAGLRPPRWYWLGLQAGVLFAFGFCVWLWSQAVYTIGALCPYCMVVWAAVIPMTVSVTARNILTGTIPASGAVRRVTADWWWVVLVLIYLLVAASIAIELPQALGI
ncbi:vitamin K epoxide reductase family protein [Nesterenkonia xinjiangensis]|uniref:Putative membrane protein n=1 Tax=Nesterenkonia xinjiangensis TaxID=225327 RepID=A0A7Z0GPX8_9MICC|nr:vitamin K epoxide reductase family protein [Nesterenkonia xinjiangensis]NYJ79524.1 putative membrane protein [Nesterenkonia xinjiangensis]